MRLETKIRLNIQNFYLFSKLHLIVSQHEYHTDNLSFSTIPPEV